MHDLHNETIVTFISIHQDQCMLCDNAPNQILLILAALIILSAVSASDNSQTNAQLDDLTMSSIITVFAAGLLAGFNPCLLAMLAFLAGAILASTGRRKDVLTMVVFFSLGTLAVYIIFGEGLFNVLQEKSTAATFRLVLAAILLILGLMQLEDARRLQIGGLSVFRTDLTKKYVTSVVASRKLSYYFLLGALFSLVRAPVLAEFTSLLSAQFPAKDTLRLGYFTY
jgi:cytochrome c-type biogenesis protein